MFLKYENIDKRQLIYKDSILDINIESLDLQSIIKWFMKDEEENNDIFKKWIKEAKILTYYKKTLIGKGPYVSKSTVEEIKTLARISLWTIFNSRKRKYEIE